MNPDKFSIRFSKLNKTNKLNPGDEEKTKEMVELLKRKGFYVRYFKSSAKDLIAGCGQLRNRLLKRNKS
ncbi:MAG: hypothetical protein ACOCUU_03530 [Nanoarchaeota archaeon]